MAKTETKEISNFRHEMSDKTRNYGQKFSRSSSRQAVNSLCETMIIMDEMSVETQHIFLPTRKVGGWVKGVSI